MDNLQEIEKKISGFSENELSLFRKWFEEFDANLWDKQFEKDVRSGKLDKLGNKALDDFNLNQFNILTWKEKND